MFYLVILVVVVVVLIVVIVIVVVVVFRSLVSFVLVWKKAVSENLNKM